MPGFFIYWCRDVLSLDNFLESESVVGDDADHVDTIGYIAQVDKTSLVGSLNGAAVEVENLDAADAFTVDSDIAGGGVRVEIYCGLFGSTDTDEVVGAANKDVVKLKNEHVGDIVVTETDIDGLTCVFGERDDISDPFASGVTLVDRIGLCD